MGQAVARYKLAAWFQWIYLLIRFLDLTFWLFKMAAYIVHDIVLKILLIRWYLTIGELTLNMYADPAGETDLSADELLSQLDSIADEEIPAELSSGAREIAEATRKSLMFNMSFVQWKQAREIYFQLVRGLAGHYYPDANEPLYEVKLYHLMMGVSRLSDQVAAIREKPVLNKLLNIRVSHIMLAKDAMDFLQESELGVWLKKYPVRQAGEGRQQGRGPEHDDRHTRVRMGKRRCASDCQRRAEAAQRRGAGLGGQSRVFVPGHSEEHGQNKDEGEPRAP